MTLSLANHLAADSAYRALRRDVFEGLQKAPKSLPPKWFYDSVGSDLFDQITRLPEYYPTRAEAEILGSFSAEIASASQADTLVELGAGTSEKTRQLLDALRDRGSLRGFVPFDVDAGMLSATATAIQREYPGVEISAVCGDFEEHLTEIPGGGRRLFVFLGSTIGNLTPEPRAEFLATLAAVMRPGDTLLLGTDLVKDTDRLVRAYDDAAGVTARFQKVDDPGALVVLQSEHPKAHEGDDAEHGDGHPGPRRDSDEQQVGRANQQGQHCNAHVALQQNEGHRQRDDEAGPPKIAQAPDLRGRVMLKGTGERQHEAELGELRRLHA